MYELMWVLALSSGHAVYELLRVLALGSGPAVYEPLWVLALSSGPAVYEQMWVLALSSGPAVYEPSRALALSSGHAVYELIEKACCEKPFCQKVAQPGTLTDRWPKLGHQFGKKLCVTAAAQLGTLLAFRNGVSTHDIREQETANDAVATVTVCSDLLRTGPDGAP